MLPDFWGIGGQKSHLVCRGVSTEAALGFFGRCVDPGRVLKVRFLRISLRT